MINKFFFIPCDIYIRDFDARLLLALSLMKKVENVTFVIGSQYEVNKYIKENENINKMIYLEKGIEERYSDWYHYLANRGCLIYTMGEEGGIFEKNRNLASFDIDAVNLDCIRKNFIWSDLIYDEMKKHKNFFFKHSEFSVTGNPRFDLCSSKFDSFHNSFLNKFKEKKCIVISSTFSAGNYRVPDESGLIRVFSTRKFLKNWYKFDIERKKYSNKLREYFISLTKEIAKDNPNIQIFFRPHPVESHEVYNKNFSKYNNIIVNNSVPARDMVAISKTLIHHDCTTAVESYLNNKIPIAYLPIFDENLVQELPVKLSLKNKTINEVKDQLNDILNKKEIINLPFNHFKYFLKNFESESCEEIAKVIVNDINNFDDILVKSAKKNMILSSLNFLRSFIIRLINKNIEIMSKVLLKKEISRSYKYPVDLNIADLDEKIQKLSNIINLQKKVETKKISKNLFFLANQKKI